MLLSQARTARNAFVGVMWNENALLSHNDQGRALEDTGYLRQQEMSENERVQLQNFKYFKALIISTTAEQNSIFN